MKFLLGEFLKCFSINRCDCVRIGFVVPNVKPHATVLGSTRIRAYDVINAFKKDSNYFLELYKPFHEYDILIFQKCFNAHAYTIAQKYKKKGCKIVFDINVNYYDKDNPYILQSQFDDIMKFSGVCDMLLASTDHIASVVKSNFPHKHITKIEESLHEAYFSKRKKIGKIKKFIWCGHTPKAKDILLIKDALLDLYKEYSFSIILVTDKNPKISIGDIPVRFIPIKKKRLTEDLLIGDCFLAPRDLTDSYNLGHAFTKIGIPMALGIPVVASPVPSYVNSPAISCNSIEEWYTVLRNVVEGVYDLKTITDAGVAYCNSHYRLSKIKLEYKNLFSSLL